LPGIIQFGEVALLRHLHGAEDRQVDVAARIMANESAELK